MFECPSCSANLKYDIASRQLSCEYCRRKYKMNSKIARTIPSMYKEITRSENDPDTEQIEVTVFTCPQCGAELYSEDNSVTSYCVYCGTDNVLQQRLEGIDPPKRILPFRQTEEMCRDKIRDYLKKYTFAPKKLKNDAVLEHMRPVYVPYWNSSVHYDGEIVGTGTKTDSSGTTAVTSIFDIQADITADVTDIHFDASAVFDDTLAAGIAPYYSGKQNNFEPKYLAGFYAEIADVDSDAYREPAAQIARDRLGTAICNKLSMSAELENRPEESYQAEQMLLPVWFTSLRQGDRIAYVVVNGVTGKVFCDVPIDIWKYLLITVLFAVPVFGLLSIFFTFAPAKAVTIAGIMTCISSITAAPLRARALRRDRHIDDRGYRRTHGTLPSPEGGWTALGPEERQQLEKERKERLEEWRTGEATGKRRKKAVKFSKEDWKSVGLCLFLMVVFFVLLGAKDENIDWKGVPLTLTGIVWLAVSLKQNIYRVDRAGQEAAGSPFGETGVSEKEKKYRIHFPGLLSVFGLILTFGAAVMLWIDPADDLNYYFVTAALLLVAFGTILSAVVRYNALSTRPIPFLKKEEKDPEQKKPGNGKFRIIRSLFVFLIAAVLTVCPIGNPAAAGSYAGEMTEQTAGEIAAGYEKNGKVYLYRNPETEYRAVVYDELDLLTFEEQQQICEQIRPLTRFGNIGMVSGNDPAMTNYKIYRENAYDSLFGYQNGTVFLFDFTNRKLSIYSRGSNYKVIDDNYAESITDNVYVLAQNGQYYACAEEAMREIGSLLYGQRIRQPMKYVNNALLSLFISGFLVFLWIRLSAWWHRDSDSDDELGSVRCKCDLDNIKIDKVDERIAPISSDSGDGGGGSSGGGGGGSSGGGGSHGF